MKWLWLPYIFWANAWSWMTYTWGKPPADKVRLLDHGWGWFDPALDAHWQALREGKDKFHLAKDLAAEWAGLARQRGPKSLCFIALIMCLTGFLSGVLVGWLA